MPQFERQAVNMTLGQLATNTVQDPRILQLLVDIPREDFVPQAQRKAAYIDQNIEIAKGRFLLAPLTFAKLLELAAVTPSCRALVIGSGNGYTTAVMAELAGHVVAIDSDSGLIAQSRENMSRLGIKDIDVQQVKNMADGYALSAPYDVIFINGGIEHLPDSLSSQLAIGGRLVAIRNVSNGLGKGILAKRFDGQVNIREYFDAGAAVLQGFEQPAHFVF